MTNEKRDAHMEAVRAVQRTSAYERLRSKIAHFQTLRRLGDEGLGQGLFPYEEEQLAGCLKQYLDLQQRMIDHGQLAPMEGQQP